MDDELLDRARKAVMRAWNARANRDDLPGDIARAVLGVLSERAWTRERPTKPGWYWCRPRYARLYVAEVVMGADGNPAVEGDDGYEWPLDANAEWAPAEPPP